MDQASLAVLEIYLRFAWGLPHMKRVHLIDAAIARSKIIRESKTTSVWTVKKDLDYLLET